MPLTEDEAKTKWCPFARVVPGRLRDGMMRPAGEVPAHNRIDEVGAEEKPTWNNAANCVGSACTAWRWGPPDNFTPSQPGYCGLAGKP